MDKSETTPMTPEQEGYGAFGCGAPNPYALDTKAHRDWWRGYLEAQNVAIGRSPFVVTNGE